MNRTSQRITMYFVLGSAIFLAIGAYAVIAPLLR